MVLGWGSHTAGSSISFNKNYLTVAVSLGHTADETETFLRKFSKILRTKLQP